MDFLEYYNKQEDKENLLNEEVATVVGAILGLVVVANLVAFGLNLLFYSQATTLRKLAVLFNKSRNQFKSAINIFTGKEKIDTKQIIKDSRAIKQRRELENVNNKFGHELRDLYAEIEKKDFDNAREEFKALSPQVKNNLEVQRAVIAKISEVLKEPPLYVRSPGNKTYQAIKKIINIRVAQASAKAVEKAIIKMKGEEDKEEKEGEEV